jgi:hypothetical protein
VRRLSLEDIEPEHWVAWVLDLPGCYGSGPTAEAAVAAALPALRAWCWRLGRPERPTEATVVERFASFLSAPDYRVNAFFADDARALSAADVALGRRMLGLTRDDLRAHLPDHLDAETTRVLEHVARAELWYLTRLALATGRESLPADPLGRLEAIRAMTGAALPRLIGDDRVVELRGERWSARKLLRRALWHEQDHVAEIARATSL